MKIVILEADSLGQDMVFTPFEALGKVVIYRSTTADEMEEKTKRRRCDRDQQGSNLRVYHWKSTEPKSWSADRNRL